MGGSFPAPVGQTWDMLLLRCCLRSKFKTQKRRDKITKHKDRVDKLVFLCFSCENNVPLKSVGGAVLRQPFLSIGRSLMCDLKLSRNRFLVFTEEYFFLKKNIGLIEK